MVNKLVTEFLTDLTTIQPAVKRRGCADVCQQRADIVLDAAVRKQPSENSRQEAAGTRACQHWGKLTHKLAPKRIYRRAVGS